MVFVRVCAPCMPENKRPLASNVGWGQVCEEGLITLWDKYVRGAWFSFESLTHVAP